MHPCFLVLNRRMLHSDIQIYYKFTYSICADVLFLFFFGLAAVGVNSVTFWWMASCLNVFIFYFVFLNIGNISNIWMMLNEK